MSHKITTSSFTQTDRSQRIWHVIDSHRPELDVFALKYGSLILALPTAFTSYHCQKFFNKRFKLGAAWYTYAPMIIPSIGSGLIHRKLVEEEVLHENTGCTGCTEFKFATVHFFSGFVWSSIMSSFAACMIGSLKKTVYVPPIEKYPLETLKYLVNKVPRKEDTGMTQEYRKLITESEKLLKIDYSGRMTSHVTSVDQAGASRPTGVLGFDQ